MADNSTADTLNTEALYLQVLNLVSESLCDPRTFNPDDLRRALDSVLTYGKIIGRRTAFSSNIPHGSLVENDRLIEDWTRIAEADIQ